MSSGPSGFNNAPVTRAFVVTSAILTVALGIQGRASKIGLSRQDIFVKLLFSSWKRSLLPGVCGILAGSLYRLNLFGIRRAKVPEFVATFFSRLFPSGGGSPRAPPSGNILRNPPYSGRQREAQILNPAPVAEPPQDSIAMLVSMGFDVNSARQALTRARNDINIATNILLEAQSH